MSDSFRVLAVDDEAPARGALWTAVRALGYECETAANGSEAWVMLSSEPFDIVLSDWRMPELDGFDLCRRIRSCGNPDRYTYFIFVSGQADREHYLAGMRAGADDFIAKPVDLDELEARLGSAKRVLDLHRRLARTMAELRASAASL